MDAETPPRARPARYTVLAKVPHWAVAAAVIPMIPWGLAMKRLVPEGPTRETLYDGHEALGAVILIVMIARLSRRLGMGVPAPEANLSALDRWASLCAQYGLYALLLIVPVLGWAGTNAYGDPVSVFGLFDFPVILAKNIPLSDEIFVLHLIGGLTIAGIVALHISGALYHRFVKRDGVLARML